MVQVVRRVVQGRAGDCNEGIRAEPQGTTTHWPRKKARDRQHVLPTADFQSVHSVFLRKGAPRRISRWCQKSRAAQHLRAPLSTLLLALSVGRQSPSQPPSPLASWERRSARLKPACAAAGTCVLVHRAALATPVVLETFSFDVTDLAHDECATLTG